MFRRKYHDYVQVFRNPLNTAIHFESNNCKLEDLVSQAPAPVSPGGV